MFYLYEMTSSGSALSPKFTGMQTKNHLGFREFILKKWDVDINQHWLVSDSFACSNFVLTTTPPGKMWSHA